MQIERLAGLALAIAAIFPAVPGPAFAQAADLALCRGNDSDEIKRLTACNRFIEGKGKKSSRDMAAAYNARGLILGQKGFRDKAIADYTSAIKASPSEAAFYINRGYQFIQLKQYDAAIEDASRAVALAPDAEMAYYYRGLAYYRKEDCRPAIPDLSVSIQRDPGFGGTYSLRAYCYEQIGELKNALADYDKHFSLGKPSATSYNNRGTTLIKLGHFARGVRDLTEALREQPDNAQSLANRGYGYRELGEFAPAIADFTRAIGREPQRASYYLERALVLARMNRDQEALADIRRALEIDPDYAVAKDVLPRIERKLTDRKQTGISQPGMPAQDATNVASRPRGVALVIGNSRYRHANPLANPSNDAADVSAALRALGFEVIEGIDLGRQAMTDAIRNFSRKLESATIGIAFFAGHGLQVSGKNFLLPVDARLERADDLEAAAVDLSRIVAAMESKDRVSLIFLDACRDNPMTQPTASAKSVGRNLGSVAGGPSTSTPDVEQGLATAKGAVGTLIAYSTQPDNVALDGDGRNSPFAAALLAHIAAPRLEIETMMKQVRLDVITATQNKQIPWSHSSLVGDVYLNGR